MSPTDQTLAAWRSRRRESKTKGKPRPKPKPKPPTEPAKSRGGRPLGSKNKIGSTSKYHHVYWCATYKRWKVCMRFAGRLYWNGTFRDELDAARAADALSLRLLGDRGPLNFPESP